MTPRIVIIGGGLAGVSAGHHLAEHEPVLFEKEQQIGGLCRSFTQDGFTFDCTGHLIHLKNAYTKELVAQLLPDAFDSHERLAAIYSKQTVTPYPFQANTYGLPPEVIRDCVVGFVESLHADHRNADNFHDWVLQTFGAGIARHFMLPYNEKFWKQDLHGITSDWVSWSIPKPTLEEVINGALGLTNKGMGYNPRFLYPRDGGIDALPRALARSIHNLHTSEAVERIDPAKKSVRFASGREEPYDYLVSTLPVPVLYSMLTGVSDELLSQARGLRAISVLNINVGVDRPGISDQHWIYFPEEEFVFSRVGFPANFSRSVTPPDTSSIYIEITHHPGEQPDVDALTERSLADLRRTGILRHGDRILTRHVLDLRFAYVVFDQHRQKYLQGLLDHLETRDIFSAGRYGRWEYFSMEDSILSGKAAAERILERLRS